MNWNKGLFYFNNKYTSIISSFKKAFGFIMILYFKGITYHK